MTMAAWVDPETAYAQATCCFTRICRPCQATLKTALRCEAMSGIYSDFQKSISAYKIRGEMNFGAINAKWS